MEPKNLHGSNIFFFHGPNDKINTHGLLEVLAESLATNLPTRFVCLIPRQALLPSHFLELAVLHDGISLRFPRGRKMSFKRLHVSDLGGKQRVLTG
jgi:hypothetical protein